MAKSLREGDRLPEFSLRDQDGVEVHSDELLGRGPVVIFFYPKDETPGCTTQACAFRDHYEVFAEAGAEVIGISRDPASSHRQFIAHHDLPFRLLTDEHGEVAKRFGVSKTLGVVPGRSTFVFDERGRLRHQFHSQLQAARHADEARRIIEELAAAP